LVERRFEPHRFPNGRREFCWSDPITNPKTGETIRRRGELQYHAGTKTMTGTFFYKITQPDGTETSEECTFDAPILFKEDYLDLFTAAGFTARITVNYEDRADDGQSPYLCFLCRKKG